MNFLICFYIFKLTTNQCSIVAMIQLFNLLIIPLASEDYITIVYLMK
jgi:hypothetical protein